MAQFCDTNSGNVAFAFAAVRTDKGLRERRVTQWETAWGGLLSTSMHGASFVCTTEVIWEPIDKIRLCWHRVPRLADAFTRRGRGVRIQVTQGEPKWGKASHRNQVSV